MLKIEVFVKILRTINYKNKFMEDLMDQFNFDDFEEKIKAAEQYKRDNYYTNYYKRPIDEYDYTKELIEVEDWEGRKGKMTLYDFCNYIGTGMNYIRDAVLQYKATGKISKVILNRFKRHFKKINFMEGAL